MVNIISGAGARHVDDVSARTQPEAMQLAVDRYGTYLDRGHTIAVVLDPNAPVTAWDHILDDDRIP